MKIWPLFVFRNKIKTIIKYIYGSLSSITKQNFCDKRGRRGPPKSFDHKSLFLSLFSAFLAHLIHL